MNPMSFAAVGALGQPSRNWKAAARSRLVSAKKWLLIAYGGSAPRRCTTRRAQSDRSASTG